MRQVLFLPGAARSISSYARERHVCCATFCAAFRRSARLMVQPVAGRACCCADVPFESARAISWFAGEFFTSSSCQALPQPRAAPARSLPLFQMFAVPLFSDAYPRSPNAERSCCHPFRRRRLPSSDPFRRGRLAARYKRHPPAMLRRDTCRCSPDVVPMFICSALPMSASAR